MSAFGQFYLDKEKDIIVELSKSGETLSYVLRTPNHGTGNLITNLAVLCGLPLSKDEKGLLVIRGEVPCYVDGYNRTVYIFRLGNTKVANIWPDGSVEIKAQIPAIAKTLMSQTKDYRLDIQKTIVKTYIRSECKFRTDLHSHMNANLPPDILIALGIMHEIRYPLYYIKKLKLALTGRQEEILGIRREASAKALRDCGLSGKYLSRRIDDNTFLNFADLILLSPEHAGENIEKIRTSLAVMKDGQAGFVNLEKVYLYRYVFTKGIRSDDAFGIADGTAPSRVLSAIADIPDPDVKNAVIRMQEDRRSAAYAGNTLFQDKLLWIARNYASRGISYAEISDTSLVKKSAAAETLAQIHAVMPAVIRETGVTIRFLAAIRRIPLTIVKDRIALHDYFHENLEVLRAVSGDPYVAGSDIIGEEINDIRDLSPVIAEITKIAKDEPSFTVRIHAGENDTLRDNVANSIICVRNALSSGQAMPKMRIGHGLYTANLRSARGRSLIRLLRESGAVLEFQITSNVRLNNLSILTRHPLRVYLHEGIPCVQGTDGGALYGTDSIDEQLALERMLGVTHDEFLAMRKAEDAVMREGLADFTEKAERFGRALKGVIPEEEQAKGTEDAVRAYYESLLAAPGGESASFVGSDTRRPAAELLADRIAELPESGFPIVIAGGSFNNDRHRTSLREDGKRLIDRLVDGLDPEKCFFVIGQSIRGYERYLVQKSCGRFRIYAFVPAMLDIAQAGRIRRAGVSVRVAIEPESMGVYKSIVYEVFKHRNAALIAFDGNSAGANLIQEAKMAKYRCRIFASAHSRSLRAKAVSLKGYVTLFDNEEDVLAELQTTGACDIL